jgi:hypothetical protein
MSGRRGFEQMNSIFLLTQYIKMVLKRLHTQKKERKKDSIEEMASRLQYHVYTSPLCICAGDVADITGCSFFILLIFGGLLLARACNRVLES